MRKGQQKACDGKVETQLLLYYDGLWWVSYSEHHVHVLHCPVSELYEPFSLMESLVLILCHARKVPI